jgi:type I restriction enzyme S subunit
LLSGKLRNAVRLRPEHCPDKIGILSESRRNTHPARSPADDVFDYIDLSAVDQDAKLITGAREASCGEAPSRARQLVARGDVLVSTVRPNLNGVARVPDLLDGATASTGFCVLRARESKFDGGYLFQWVKSPAFVADMVNKATGASYPAVSDRIIFDSRIPLPPLAEQRRIAEVLDRAEALRAKRRAALAQLDSLTQSLFLDLFGDPATKGWAMTDIAGVVNAKDGSIRTGPFGSQLLHREFTDHGIAVLGIDNAVANEFRWGERRFISETKYRQLKRYTVRPGDVLITIMGTCGRCAVVPNDIPPAINTKHLCCITLDPEKCLPVFLHAYFLLHPIAQKYLSQTAKGAIMSGLNMGLIKGMPVPLPPISMQREFARRVTAVERLKTAHRASLAELDALFATLQHRAFRGEL